MSSRRLLVLVTKLPETSAFKTAAREHDWPLQAQLQTATVNEIKALRGDMWALIGHESMAFKPILSPAAEHAKAAERAHTRAVHDDINAQLRGTRRG